MAATACTIVGGGKGYIAPLMYQAAADPTVDNDTLHGFNLFDRVLNTATGQVSECRGNTAGAAVWVQIPRQFAATVMPAAGTWKAGDFVHNTSPAIVDGVTGNYTVYGWSRLTTGAANVLNTDWVEVRGGSSLFTATAQPATGTWTAGDFVANTAPVEAGSGGSKYVVIGWKRLTTGSGNLATTDWLACRCLTGN